MKLSVVTVTYNDARWVRGLVESVERSMRGCGGCVDDAEVVIVDNGSGPDEVRELRDITRSSELAVRVYRLSKNYGYSGGVYAGVRLARFDVVAVSNPDVVVEEDFVGELARILGELGEGFLERAIIAPKILLGDTDRVNSTGMSLHAAGYGILNNLYRRDGEGWTGSARIVTAPHGAFFIGSRRALVRLGPFLPAYFSFLEDLDLGLRAYALGYRVVYAPSLVVRHYWGLTWGRALTPAKYYYAERNRLLTVLRSVPADVLLRMLPFLALSEAVSIAYALLSGYPRKKAEIYAYILRFLREILRERREVVRNADDLLRDVLLGGIVTEFVHTEFDPCLERAVNGLFRLIAKLVGLGRRVS